MSNIIFDPLLSNIRSDDSDNSPDDIIKYDVFLDKLRLVDKNGGIYYDYVLNMVRNGTLLNLYNPSKDTDLTFFSKSISGKYLIDEIGENNAPILLPHIKILDAINQVGVHSGVIPTANTVVVITGSFPTANARLEGSSATFAWGSTSQSGYKYFLRWGTKIGWSATINYGSETLNIDGNFHTYIIYNKKFWLVEPTLDLTDANILNVINTVTPLINLSDATYTEQTVGISILQGYAGVAFYGDRSLTYIGNLVAGTITWQKKYVFTNERNAYDILNGVKVDLVNLASGRNLDQQEALGYTCNNSKGYNLHGYDLLKNGHSLCHLEGTGLISIPFDVNDNPIAGEPLNYIRLHDIVGNLTKHNLSVSIIRYPLGSVFDRSNATIYEDAARAVGTFYDAANPTDWHISEHNRLLLNEWLKTDYKGIWFPHETPNSVEIDEKILLDEVFACATNKTGDDFDNVLKYTNDLNIMSVCLLKTSICLIHILR
jgi:hypothetical protein